jgi:outer membrane biosynthesis protein TonB
MTRCALILIIGPCLVSPSLTARQGNSPVTCTLKATPKTVAWGFYDAQAAALLRVKSGDNVGIQTPITSTATPDKKEPVRYVKHLEPPYPPLARMTRVEGIIEMKLNFGADGTVLSVESVPRGYGSTVLTLLKHEVEKT